MRPAGARGPGRRQAPWPGPALGTWPRRALVVLLVSVLGLLALTAAPVDRLPWSAVQFALALTAVTATWRVLRWRTRRATAERLVWRLLSAGCFLYGVGTVATAACALVPAATGWQELPATVCAVLTFPLAYRALVRWTRHRFGADPDDLLNGLSALLVAVGLLGTAVFWRDPHPAAGLLPLLPRPLSLLVVQNAAVLVLLGTAVAAATTSRFYRDPRLGLVTAAYLLAGAGGVHALLVGGAHPSWAVPVWGLGLLALSSAPLLPVRFVPVRSADPVTSTVGSFVVVLAGLGVAVVVVVTGAPGALALLGLAGVLGAAVRLLVNLQDLVELTVRRREALSDDLTGTANRRALVRHLDHLLGASGGGVQVVVFDLDHFKEVNDSLGHGAGDDLLRMVAQRLRSALPAVAVLGRLGGDEFTVVSADGTTGREVLDALDRVQREPFPVAGTDVHVDLSVGRTTWSGPRPLTPPPVWAGPVWAGPVGVGTDPVDAAALLRRADSARADAKRGGRGRVTYDAARHAGADGLLAVVGELRHGVGAGQLRVHYQPQLSVCTGELTGVEALVRWQHPVRGLLGPDRFLPVAESHGLMGAVTREMLEQVVAQQAVWRRRGLDLRVSVNLAAGTLLDTSLPGRVQALLERHGVPATSLVLEVTETVLMRDPDRSLGVVRALRALGAQISIDDFGTGYSSLTQLRRLPVGELKLDRSFTADLLGDPRTAAILAGTVALAHALQLRVVAEGVEDDATLAALAALGCDETQGYLHAEPLPAADLDRWIADGHRNRRAGAATPPSPVTAEGS